MSLARSLALPFLLLLSSSHLWASPDAPPVGTRFGKDIHVAAGQNVQDDLTCFSCSIYIQGNVAGDVTAFKGKIVIEGPAQVAGDVTTIVGDVVVGPETKIAGDVTAVGGGIQRAPDAQISGDVVPIRRGWWVTLLLISPLIVLGALIAAAVWLIQYLFRRPRGIPATA